MTSPCLVERNSFQAPPNILKTLGRRTFNGALPSFCKCILLVLDPGRYITNTQAKLCPTAKLAFQGVETQSPINLGMIGLDTQIGLEALLPHSASYHRPSVLRLRKRLTERSRNIGRSSGHYGCGWAGSMLLPRATRNPSRSHGGAEIRITAWPRYFQRTEFFAYQPAGHVCYG
jgi:hypothetical protein